MCTQGWTCVRVGPASGRFWPMRPCLGRHGRVGLHYVDNWPLLQDLMILSLGSERSSTHDVPLVNAQRALRVVHTSLCTAATRATSMTINLGGMDMVGPVAFRRESAPDSTHVGEAWT
jgi:hypothetical protein